VADTFRLPVGTGDNWVVLRRLDSSNVHIVEFIAYMAVN
jgi:hypothetical protein